MNIKYLASIACTLIITAFPSVALADESLRLARPENNFSTNDTSVRVPLTGRVRDNATSEQLTTVQLQRLAAHDIVLLVDKSGSMATADCPASAGNGSLGAILPALLLGQSLCTRWNWCLSETTRMAKQTERVLPNGFTVVLFESRFMIFPHVTVAGLAQVFHSNQPWGGTDLGAPLESVFSDYFNRKRISNGAIKPLLIGVITDGCPNSPKKVREAIIHSTQQMNNANEITIIFFLIGGHDWSGEKFVNDLRKNLVSKGATFNIVKAVSFQDLKKMGLAWALADNLQ